MTNDQASTLLQDNLLFPFVRTPSNLVHRLGQYTPGINLMASSEIRQKWFSPDAEVRASARGRFYLGGAFWTVATSAVMAGKITGSGPKNAQERQQLMATGWQPYSLVFTNADGSKEYFGFNRFDPFGMLLGMAADYAEASAEMEDDEIGDVAAAMTGTVAKGLVNKTYMRGLANFVEAMSDSDRYGKAYLKQLAGSLVPSILNGIKDDEVLRETQTVLDAIKARLPGYSETLAPRRNIFGEPITPSVGWLPFDGTGTQAARMLSPVAYSKSVDDSVKTELAKLGHGFSLPEKKFQGQDLRLHKNAQGQDAYDRLLELHGEVKIGGRTLPQALDRLIKSERYQRLPEPQGPSDITSPRIKEVQAVLFDYRRKALKSLLKEVPSIPDAIRSTQQARKTLASMGGDISGVTGSGNGGTVATIGGTPRTSILSQLQTGL